MILAIVLTAVENSIFGEETNWFTLRSTEGRFSIKFPTRPKELSFDRQTVKGVIPYHVWTLESPDKAYNVTYIDLPDITASDGEKLVDATLVSQINERIGGKVLEEKDVKIGNHPGKEFKIEMGDGGGLYRGRAFMVGVRQFTLLVFGEPKRESKDDFTFFDSFRLLTNQPPAQPKDQNLKQ